MVSPDFPAWFAIPAIILSVIGGHVLLALILRDAGGAKGESPIANRPSPKPPEDSVTG